MSMCRGKYHYLFLCVTQTGQVTQFHGESVIVKYCCQARLNREHIPEPVVLGFEPGTPTTASSHVTTKLTKPLGTMLLMVLFARQGGCAGFYHVQDGPTCCAQVKGQAR